MKYFSDIPPVKSVIQEDLLTRITSVPQRQSQMQGGNLSHQRLQQIRTASPMRGQNINRSHMERHQNPVHHTGIQSFGNSQNFGNSLNTVSDIYYIKC